MKNKTLLALMIVSASCSTTSFSTFANSVSYFAALDVDTSSASIEGDSAQFTRGQLAIGAEFDLSYLLSEDSSFYVSYGLRRGDNGSDFVGDMQSFSNIDEDEYSKLYEVIFTKAMSDTSNLKFGLMDATADFAAPYYGGDFINASMGFSPTIGGISTYPTPHLGVYYDTQFSHIKLKLGTYSAEEDDRLGFGDSFQIAEVEVPYAEESVVRFGVWHHTGLENSDGETESVADFYAVLDHNVNSQMNGFVQYGNADTEFNEIETHWAIGLNYLGLLFEDESSGIVLSQISVDGIGEETAIEFYSNFTINDYLSIKPSFIRISDVSGKNSSGDATIINVRMSIEL